MKKFIVFILLLIWIGFSLGYSLSKSTKLIVSEIQKLTQVIKDMEKQLSSLNKRVEIIDDKVSILTQNQADFNQNRERLNLSLQFIKEEINELKNKITKVNDGLLMLSRKDIRDSGELDTEEVTDSLLQSPENIYYTSYSDYLKKTTTWPSKDSSSSLVCFRKTGSLTTRSTGSANVIMPRRCIRKLPTPLIV